MATSPTQNKSLIANWLLDQALRSSVDNPPQGLAFSMADRQSDGVALGYRVTTARTPSDSIPFTIYFLNSNELSSGSLPKEDDRSLTLLINPSELNYGSTQLVTSQYARKGFVNSLWGSSQGTLVGSGSSAAFMGPHYGLDGPTVTNATSGANVTGSSKRSSLAYGNVMSLVAVMRNNGYFPLGNNNISSNDPSNRITNTNSNPSSPVSAALSGNSEKTRIVHVLSVVAVKYDGTTYLGSFNSFSLEASGETPFRFSYSFEFAVSGLLGDVVDGHICDGHNQETGIVIKMQGSQFFTQSIQMDLTDVQASTVDKAIADANGNLPSVALQASYTPEQLAINQAEVLKYVAVKEPSVSFDAVHQEILDILPTLNAVYTEYTTVEKPTITSTTGSAPNRKVNKKGIDPHTAGYAIDVSTETVKGKGPYAKYSHQDLLVAIRGALRQRLPESYFLDYECPPKYTGVTPHIHIQYNGAT